MTMFLVADADGTLWLFGTYPHRYHEEWVSESVGDSAINIDESILEKFGIEPPNFVSEPIPVSFTLKTYSE